ncbi:hypothetical protein LEL_10556 [Akanthomyces lecanii RCEF 1005]|uniref:Uncharacterized protein n=1 Tax=Akanthomyces lecanii RCEF 1005 TaxID=1081108 RepID=A0A167XL54_CORDF|nr:hypothetical protein LEL_10556 [Akanthomyces lecanii RCEF 1005]
MLPKHVQPPSELSALLTGQRVLPYRSVQEILDVRAVDVVGLARQGADEAYADEAYAPVVHSEQGQNVSACVAEKLPLSECRPAWSSYLHIRVCGVSARRREALGS